MPLIALLLAGGGSRSATAADEPSVIYVESGSAGHGLQAEKIENCVRLLIRELGVEGKPLPTIVVVHVSARDAARAGLKNIAAKVLLNYQAETSKDPYYELWLAGEPATYDYVYALYFILVRHFGQHHTESEQKSTIARVVRWMDATVSAKK